MFVLPSFFPRTQIPTVVNFGSFRYGCNVKHIITLSNCCDFQPFYWLLSLISLVLRCSTMSLLPVVLTMIHSNYAFAIRLKSLLYQLDINLKTYQCCGQQYSFPIQSCNEDLWVIRVTINKVNRWFVSQLYVLEVYTSLRL